MPQSEARGAFVLVVEDEFLISAMIAEALSEHGFEVHTVANAREALRHLERGADCDILFTDIHLPGGIDGTALARLARELRPGLVVIYASGSCANLEPAAMVSGGTFVAKPYDPDKVCMQLHRMVPVPLRGAAPGRGCTL